jgi:hypothetical protein
MATRSRNQEVEYLVKNINDRLFFIAMMECTVSEEMRYQVVELCSSFCTEDRAQLKIHLNSYYRKRIEALPSVVADLLRS